MKCIIALCALVAPLAPLAAAPRCVPPPAIATPTEEGASAREPTRLLPIGGYTLSIIWLADACRAPGGAVDCRSGAGRRGFVLHGLWPDGTGKDWPQWCAPAPPLPPATLRAHYCATPSAQLTQHEWAKHGTCMPGYDADRYLALSRRLFAAVRPPDLRALSYGRPTVGRVQRAFAAADRGLRPDMLRLNVDRRGWLTEVWFCLDRDFRRTRCPGAGARPGDPVRIRRGTDRRE